MPDLKRITPSRILWLDLEMSGLDATTDVIVEVAAVVTDWDFASLDTFDSGVGGDMAHITERFNQNEFYNIYSDNKKQLLKLAAESPASEVVEDRLIALIDKHFKPDEPALLAGNSIHTDRLFIRRQWPRLDARLHYRMLDVSAWKLVMIAKYDTEYKKKETHRALDDVRESIEELKFYLRRVQ